MTEEWRPINLPPISDYYEVSDQGRVRRKRGGKGTRAGWAMTPFLAHMYMAVKLTVRGLGFRKTIYIHDLVAGAFIGPKPVALHVNHVNLDKFDNRAANLEYVTPAENVAHAMRAEAIGNALLTADKVTEIRRLAAQGIRRKDLARRFGVGPQAIWAVITRRTWKHVPDGHLMDADLESAIRVVDKMAVAVPVSVSSSETTP